MSLFVFNNQQKLIKSIQNRDLISVVQDQAINVSDTLFVEMPADIWSNLKEPASYLAVQDPYERFSYHMYKVSKHTTKADTVDVEAVQVGYDELKAYGYIKDRRFSNRPVLEATTAIVDGTDWQLGYIDTNLPNVNTNFYYISRLEALSKLIEATGAEVRFRVEISGNKIIAKRMDLYKKLGTFKGKRFAYGSNLLEIIKEEDTSELYTALVGRGKGEETDTGGFGRRITFADVAWSKASGKPADKPLGQEFIELPEMTAYYGYPDGEPRTGIVEFGDIEEPELLLEATYERLVETSRPQVQFKAKVQTTGDMQLGEEVAIIRSDLGFRYKTRVFRVKRDYLNNMYTEVELGDKLTETLASRIKKIDVTNAQREETIIQYIQTAANGKNKIFRGPIEPTEGMMVNDLWYKPVGEGETMLYTWNGEIWELSKVSAGLLAGTLDAENGDVNLINVNVANIVGETSNFVQSWWNGIADTVNIANGALTTYSNTDGSRTRLTSGLLEVWNDTNNKTGSIGVGYNVSDPSVTGIAVNLEYGKEFSVRRKINYGDSAFSEAFGINWNLSQFSMRMNMSLHGNDILAVGKVALANGINMGYSRIEGATGIDFHSGAFVTGSIQAITNSNIGLFSSGNLALGVGNRTDGTTEIMRLGLNRIDMYRSMYLNRVNVWDAGQMSFSNASATYGNIVNVTGTNDLGVYGAGSLYLGVNGGGDYASPVRVQRTVVNVSVDLDMGGKSILNQSDIRLKTNVVDSQLEALKEIERMKFIEYDWDLTNPANKDKSEGRNFGIVAQYSPFLQTKAGEVDSYLSVDMTKQVNLNSKAIQELLNRIKVLEGSP